MSNNTKNCLPNYAQKHAIRIEHLRTLPHKLAHLLLLYQSILSLVVLNETKKETVQCNRGDVIVFRGDKCHAGAEYEYCDNLRFHYYFDSPDSTRKEGETYIKDWFGPQLEEKQSITNKRKRSDEQKLELKEKNIKNLNKRFKK